MAIGIDMRGESYGLLVDAVGEVMKFPNSACEAKPANLDARWSRVASGVIRLEGQLLVVLDVDRVLDMRKAGRRGVRPWRSGLDKRGEVRGQRSESEGEMKICLVVDDSSVIRKVARRILEGLDFQIVEAEDGEQALGACQRQLPDAVLLDWNMPKMDGYEFLKALRRLPGGDRPKVVFCTTENDVAHIARALHAGANEYIMKPFDREIVEAKFQEVGLI